MLNKELGQINAIPYLESAATSEFVVTSRGRRWINSKRHIAGAVIFTVVIMSILIYVRGQQESKPASYTSPMEMSVPINNEHVVTTGGIPKELQYVTVDTKRLQTYLQNKNSILAEEPYMSAIIKASNQYDIHPLLLFAITGQEQGFVSRNHKDVNKIANNPFNVFGSWESYNTTIADSATIAAKTVANISNRRLKDSHPIQWLNQTYAEDPNWWKGVTWFFNEMLVEIEDDSFEWND